MSTSRNLGVDLLRSVSMLMVVILHVLGAGGVLAAQSTSSAGHNALWLLELLCFCAVDCYGLISGFTSTLTADSAQRNSCPPSEDRTALRSAVSRSTPIKRLSSFGFRSFSIPLGSPCFSGSLCRGPLPQET